MKPLHFLALLLLGSIWGASFLFIGIAVKEFGPVMLMFLRVFIAGLILVGIVYLMRRTNQPAIQLHLRKKWRSYLILGLLNSALPFTLIAFSELTISTSLAAILNSTTPLFAALVATVYGSEQLTMRKIVGILLGICGVAVLMGGSSLAINRELIIAIIASLLAACCYGSATVYASRHVTNLPAIYASIIQLLSAAILLAPLAVFTAPPTIPSLTAVMALTALIVLSTSCAYLLYFFLLRRVGPTRTASVTFLVPIFGSIWGVAFLHEPFSIGMVLGMGIIFASISLVTNLQWRGQSIPQLATQSRTR